MGLRINTNVSALAALRVLHLNDRTQGTSLERLSTGLRINRGADDPSGLVISEQLRQQLASLSKAVENSQNAANMVSVADAALGEVSNLLIDINDSITFALNTGGATPDQIAAEQDSVDQALSAIDRIGLTTRFGDRELLNGSAGYKLTSSMPTQTSGALTATAFKNLEFRGVSFQGTNMTRDLGITLSRRPQRAELIFNDPATAAGGATLRIVGTRGTADVTLAGGLAGDAAAATTVASAINAVAETTGVFAQAVNAGGPGGVDDVVLRTEDFGLDAFIEVQGVSGTFSFSASAIRGSASGADGEATAAGGGGVDLTAGEVTSDRGLDAQVLYQGVQYTATSGTHFSINTIDASFEFDLNEDLYHPVQAAFQLLAVNGPATGTAVTLTVGNTGLNFQLREKPVSTDKLSVGISAISGSVLGFDEVRDVLGEATLSNTFATTVNEGGFLSSIKTGGGNDLTQNAGNAHKIISYAIHQVAGVRGYLGAVTAFNLEPNIDAVAVHQENLAASLSDLRDLDFAEETANFTRSQILFQSSIAALASANLVPQSILTLLS